MKKTRFIPYGYTIREGRTVIEHTEAEIIREIFDEYIKGASLKEIAESLTQRKQRISRSCLFADSINHCFRYYRFLHLRQAVR